MANATMTSEDNYHSALAAARRRGGGAEGSQKRGADEDRPPWLIAFLGVGLYSLFMIPVVFIVPPLVPVLNYCVVLALWLWAKMRGLKPPTFSSSLNTGAGKVAARLAGPEVQAAAGAAQAAESIPGASVGASLFFVVFSSGITPFIYLASLWWNNR